MARRKQKQQVDPIAQERASREQAAEAARLAWGDAQAALGALYARLQKLAAQERAIGDPAVNWRALRDIRDERAAIQQAIPQAETVKEETRARLKLAEQRAADAPGIAHAVALAAVAGG